MSLPKIQYRKKEQGFVGCFGIVFGERQYVNLEAGRINVYIPFEGSEKKCWDCGGNREIVVILALDGEFVKFTENCHIPLKKDQINLCGCIMEKV